MTAVPPAIRLQPFDAADFEDWRAQAIPAYALEHVTSQTWSVAECLVRSQEAYDALLPAGQDTTGHSFCHIVATSSARRVGYLWWAEADAAGRAGLYVYGIEIREGERRQGYARAALNELERVACERGLGYLSLHVFGHNTGARGLYADLGFEPTSITLRKNLD
ncbi:MAG TPA: GNAT family N-acetyltransferase [Burkholderiaceae bacterium]|nr:GNAT family N-acetyltransferase [Burkholderiaceae bacterium]